MFHNDAVKTQYRLGGVVAQRNRYQCSILYKVWRFGGSMLMMSMTLQKNLIKFSLAYFQFWLLSVIIGDIFEVFCKCIS